MHKKYIYIKENIEESVHNINDEQKEVFAQLENDNYKKVNDAVTLFTVEKDGQKLANYTDYMLSSDQKNLVSHQVIVDTESGTVLERNIVNMDLVNNEAEVLFHSEYTDEAEVSIQKTFKMWGKSFACSMMGLLACAAQCATLHFVSLPVGLGCDAVCGTAFAAVCAFA